jgi:hypothetical protein
MPKVQHFLGERHVRDLPGTKGQERLVRLQGSLVWCIGHTVLKLRLSTPRSMLLTCTLALMVISTAGDPLMGTGSTSSMGPRAT